MKPAIYFACLIFAVLAGGCGKHHQDHGAHDHDSNHHHEEAGEARYEAESGLTFSEHALEVLQPRTTVAQSHSLNPTRTLHARIFATTPEWLASAHVPADEAAPLVEAYFSSARLDHIDHNEAPGIGLVGLVIALAPAPKKRVGDFVEVKVILPAIDGLLVPRETVLTTAEGNFVYVQNGESWQRVPVTFTSVDNDALITDGLAAGATVLVSPVIDFWLTELRLTKGGGHSH